MSQNPQAETPPKRQETTISTTALWAIIKVLGGIFVGGWMVAAGLLGNAIVNRLDKQEMRLANIEQLNSAQNTAIEVIKTELRNQSKLDDELREMRDRFERKIDDLNETIQKLQEKQRL